MGMCNIPLLDSYLEGLELNRTLLLQDGLLAINVPFDQWDVLSAQHGGTIKTYDFPKRNGKIHPWRDDGNNTKIKKVVAIQPTTLESAYYLFQGCSNCTEIDMTNIDISQCKNLDSMFSQCTKLTNIIGLEDMDVSNATGFSSIFANSGLEGDIVLPWTINTSERVNMTSMFWNTKVTSLDLRTWDTSHVWNFPSIFSGCSELETIYVSEKWTLSAAEYATNMFNNCPKLVGGDGTAWRGNSSMDYKYAIIDGGQYSMGYLTGVDLPDYTLTYQNPNPIAPTTHPYMSVAMLPTNPTCADPDMHFYGWYPDWNFDDHGRGITHQLMDGDHEVIARWEGQSYWVDFVVNHPYYEQHNSFPPKLYYADTEVYPPYLGYDPDFVAWYMEPDFSGPPVYSFYITQDTKLYAKWSWN